MITHPLIYCTVTKTILCLDDCVILEVDADASESLHEEGIEKAKEDGFFQAYEIPLVQEEDRIEI